MNRLVWLIGILATASLAQAEWITVYTEDFEKVPVGAKTGAGALANWEQFSAAGVVHDGQPKKAGGHFLVPQHGWSSFNQGPIFNLDLAAGLPKPVDERAHLTAGHRHRLRIEYVNPDGRAELKLLWSSRAMDSTRVDKARLFPK